MFFSWIPLSNLDQIEVGPHGKLQIPNKKIIQIKKRQDVQKNFDLEFQTDFKNFATAIKNKNSMSFHK